jgi:hypothetical protein
VPLSADEKAQLEALTKKAKEPERSSGGGNHRLNVSIDLADEAQVKRAQKLGLLGDYAPDDESDEEAGGDGDDGGDPPKRGGYFNS